MGPSVQAVYPSREDRIQRTTLPIWTMNSRRPIIKVLASELTAQERKSVVNYWLNVWAFIEGVQSDIGDWTGEAYRIAGYDIETSLDTIEDHADEYNIPDTNKDIYQEL